MTLPAALDATVTATIPPVCVFQRITLWAMPVADTEGRGGWLCRGGAACVPRGGVQWHAVAC